MRASPVGQSKSDCDPPDRDAIVRILQSQSEAWGRGDAEGYAATAGSDLSFTNIRGQRWIGRSEFTRIHESVFHGVYAGSTLDLEIEQITFPGSGVAVAEVLLCLSGGSGMPAGIVGSPDGLLRTRLVEIFEKRDGQWALVTYHNTVVVAL
jgi:uncharacterized protein (TIGR02246 family)